MEKENVPLRILHVVGALTCGGVENWLLQVLQHIDRDRFQLDFMVHTAQPAAYDDSVKALGSRIIPCVSHSNPWRYASQFGPALSANGPYHIIHSHVHYFSGFVLRLATKAGIPIRIAHSHNDTSTEDRSAGWPRKLYMKRMRSWINKYATAGIAASREAAIALYGAAWDRDDRWRILYYGIECKRHPMVREKAQIRAEFGIPCDALLIGHVGMFRRQKNHAFLIEIIGCLVERMPNVYVLLVGDGPLRASVEARVARAGISRHIRFAGTRHDVQELLSAAIDVFLFPSLWEGLPLALLEAQAAGVPCVISDAITEEADVIPKLIRRMSLDQPVATWADAVLNAQCHRPHISPEEALAQVENSPFSGRNSTRALEKFYSMLIGTETGMMSSGRPSCERFVRS
jgi:glycosyltransferase involved in cell wall biosynthesis